MVRGVRPRYRATSTGAWVGWLLFAMGAHAACAPKCVVAQERVEPVAPGEARQVAQSDETSDDTLWVPRLLFAVPRLVFDAATLPLVGLAALEDEHQLVDRAEDFFFNDERTFGVFPTAFIETGNSPNVGLRVLHRDLFGGGERMRLRAGYGGDDQLIYRGDLRTGRVGERTRITLGGGYRREDRGRFYGFGNADSVAQWRISSPVDPYARDVAVKTEYFTHGSWLEASGTLQPEPNLAFTFSQLWRNRTFETVPGEPGEPALDEAYDTSRLANLGEFRSDFVVGLEVELDTRIARRADVPVALPAAGWLFSAAVERQMRMEVTRSDYSRVRVDLNRYIDVYRGDRVLRLRLRGEWVVGEIERISFVDLATLGGHQLLRGYGRGRFRDRASALGSAEYRYPVGESLAAYVFADVGRVYPNVDEVRLRDLRMGFGAGLYLYSTHNTLLRLQVASSIDGGLFFRLDFNLDDDA
jgi:outer membrane protein assembly factor BamA